MENSKKHVFRYLVLREGVRNKVYKDSKGIPTVGIGHKVVPGDRLSLGDVIPANAITAYFNFDYSRLQLDGFFDPFWWRVPHKVAVSSFIWTHGRGGSDHKGFTGGTTERMVNSQTTTATEIQAYLKLNWDKTSPVNISRNQADFQLWQRYDGDDTGSYYRSEHSSGNFYYNDWLQESFFDKADMIRAYQLDKGGQVDEKENSNGDPGCLGGAIGMVVVGGFLLKVIFGL